MDGRVRLDSLYKGDVGSWLSALNAIPLSMIIRKDSSHTSIHEHPDWKPYIQTFIMRLLRRGRERPANDS